MIKVTRTAKPSVLVKNEIKWKAAIIEAKSEEKLTQAISKYKHAEIKESLSLMFHGKCAFCESYIFNVDYGDIEHFRPKSKFPDLAVEWNNLLLSCRRCNGSDQKGDQWPLEADGGPLINPCEENPEEFLEFLFDVRTNVSLVIPKNNRGTVSEKIFGLNKHSLIKDRNEFVKKLAVIASFYHTDQQAKAIVDEAIEDQGEYAAFARMIKTNYTQSPG